MKPSERGERSQWWKAFLLLVLVFLFMSSVSMMGGGFKLLGKKFSEALLTVTGNPFAGLMIGVMTTAVVQSSSLTTSLVVGLVAAGTLDIKSAVPVVMGANIGTTITCTLVALGFVGRRGRFRRAFAAGTMHDFFNIITVIIVLPIELATGILSKLAVWLAGEMATLTRFSSPKSPIKIATSLLGKYCKYFLLKIADLSPAITAIIMLVVSLALLFVSLYYLTRIMKGFLANRMETVLDRYIFRTPVTALLVGFLFTAAVQSSSVTTSLIVPLVAAGVVRQAQAFPYTMGANVGTTLTALLAAVGIGNPAGLAIALVHTFFNLTGVAIFLPVARIRNIPVKLSQMLAALTLKSRWYALVYILVVFFIIPVIFILLWK